MASLAFSLCCLAGLVAPARSVRLQQDQAEELPWTKAAAIGLALGTRLSGHVALASPDTDIAHSIDVDDDSVKAVFDGTQAALIAIIHDNGRFMDETVVVKLMNSLRRSKSVDRSTISALESSFLEEHDRRPEIFSVASAKDPGKEVIQQMFFPDGQGRHGVIVARYLKHYREVSENQAVHEMLRQMELSNSLEAGMVLRCIAQSHTADELAGADSDTEFMIMFEPSSGSLLELLSQGHFADFNVRVGLLLDAFGVVQMLHDSNVPHRSEITPETVMVKGTLADLDSLQIVFSPALLLDVESSTTSAIESYNADVQQLGGLLRWLFNANWPTLIRPRSELLLAFGKALEGGALLGNHVALKEMAAVMKMAIDQDVSPDTLFAARMKYLQLAMSVAKPPETG